MFAAGCMVLRLFLGSHGTLVTVSAPLMMPLRDSDIPMNVPFTFRNKQPLPPTLRLSKVSAAATEVPLFIQSCCIQHLGSATALQLLERTPGTRPRREMSGERERACARARERVY
jgi:hypothetical protein